MNMAQQQGLFASLATLSIGQAGVGEVCWPEDFNVINRFYKLEVWNRSMSL